MKLAHAIRVAEGHVASGTLTSQERVALTVLVKMGKRVIDTRPSLRAVVRAVYGEDLNQTELSELFTPPSASEK
jgi:hypothetical protein